jgi:hypothetical protein
MLYVQELSFRLGTFFAGTGHLLENPTVSLLRIIHTNEVHYIVPCSELASTTTITTQSCVDGTVPLSIPLPAKAKCNVVNNQRARDALAAKTAIVEKPASKDGVGSTEDCVSQYSADKRGGPLSIPSSQTPTANNAREDHW